MIRLHFPKNAFYARPQEVCQIAYPLPQGKITDPSGLSVVGPSGAVPTQHKVTSKWPDGSVRWLLSVFEADLPANRSCSDYAIDAVAAPAHSTPASAIIAPDGSALIDTGCLQLHLGKCGESIFDSVFLNGSLLFSSSEIAGPFFCCDGTEYTALTGAEGWKIAEEGPVRVRLETHGKHYAGEKALLDLDMAIIAFAGKPYIQIEYRFIHREDVPTLSLSAMRMVIHPQTTGQEWLYATSNYSTAIHSSKEQPLSHRIDVEYLKYLENEQNPQIHMGTYFADWRDDHRGICTTFYQAYQNFPKGFDVQKNGYVAWIIPEDWGALEVPQGVAKTNRFMMEFHDGTRSTTDLDLRSLYYQMPDKPSIDSSVFTDAGLFTEFIGNKKNLNVELYLRSLAEQPGHAYGMLHWGDFPDGSYTNQGRAHGDYVWLNNEYDYPHQICIEYARTGNRYDLDCMLTSARHQMDVDVCHYSKDPLLMGGQHTHSRNHVEHGCSPSHEWVEGMFDYYHYTGDEFARETAMGIAENVRYVLVNVIFKAGERYTAAREAGWALRTFCAMYEETGDEEWLAYGEKIVDYFDQWKQDYGAWLCPYTTATMIRVPFMISVAAVSLGLYYRLRPSDRVRELIVSAVDDLLENAQTYEGGFMYYKELLSLQRSYSTPLTMHAAAMAYELTGNAKYIQSYMNMFRYLILFQGASRSTREKTANHDSLLISGPSLKSFSCSYPCIVSFYKHAMDLGLLEEGFMSPTYVPSY